MISLPRPVLTSRLDRRPISEMAALSSSLHSSTWCSRARSNGSPRKMLMLICNIFWRFAAHSPSEGCSRIQYVFTFSRCNCWERRSSGSTPTRKLCLLGKNAPMHFFPSSFRWAKPAPFGTRSQAFNSSRRNSSQRGGNVFKIISQHAHTTEWRSGSSSKSFIMG